MNDNSSGIQDSNDWVVYDFRAGIGVIEPTSFLCMDLFQIKSGLVGRYKVVIFCQFDYDSFA